MPRISKAERFLKAILSRALPFGPAGISGLSDYQTSLETSELKLLDGSISTLLADLDAQYSNHVAGGDYGPVEVAEIVQKLANVTEQNRIEQSIQASRAISNALTSMQIREAVTRKLLSNRASEIAEANARAAPISDPSGDAPVAVPHRSIVAEFVAKLSLAGLTARAILDISKVDIVALVQILNSRDRSVSLPAIAADIKPSVPKIQPGMSVPDDPADRTIDDCFLLPDDPKAGIRWQTRSWTKADQPRTTSAPDAFPVPRRDTPEAMAEADPAFAALPIDWTNGDAIERDLGGYIRQLVGAEEGKLPPNWRRLWIYMLFARHNPDGFNRAFGSKSTGYFANLILARADPDTPVDSEGNGQYQVRFNAAPRPVTAAVASTGAAIQPTSGKPGPIATEDLF